MCEKWQKCANDGDNVWKKSMYRCSESIRECGGSIREKRKMMTTMCECARNGSYMCARIGE